LRIHFNIILIRLIHFSFRYQKPICFSLLSHTCYIPRPSHPS
jgi:hypothetical protein